MNLEQSGLIASMIFLILLLTVTIVALIIVIIYWIDSKLLKNKLSMNGEKQWYEIAIAGAIILAIGQLTGALCGVIFPIWLGPDVSDYVLSSHPEAHSYDYNSTFNEFRYTRTQIDTSAYLIFTSEIIATNLHPLRDYNREIYLNILKPSYINATLSNFAIKVGEKSILYVYAYDKKPLLPGRYVLIVQGVGGDGKTRNCSIFLDVYRNQTLRQEVGPSFQVKATESNNWFGSILYFEAFDLVSREEFTNEIRNRTFCYELYKVSRYEEEAWYIDPNDKERVLTYNYVVDGGMAAGNIPVWIKETIKLILNSDNTLQNVVFLRDDRENTYMELTRKRAQKAASLLRDCNL